MSIKNGFEHDNIKLFCERYGCELITSKDDLDEDTKLLEIISYCGHHVTVTFNKLLKHKVGIYCDDCVEQIKIDGAICFGCGKNFIPTDKSLLFCSTLCSHSATEEKKQKNRSALAKYYGYYDDDGQLIDGEAELKEMKRERKIKKARENGIYERVIISHEDVTQEYKNKNCIMLTTKDEFDNLRISVQLGEIFFKIKSSCGHVTEDSSFYSFKRFNIGVKCKKCTKIDASALAKINSKNEDGIASTVIIEKNGIDLIQNICKEQLEIKKTREGCGPDILVRPFNKKTDVWLKVQLKISKGDKYAFDVKKRYSDMLVLLVNIPNKKFWIFDGNDENMKIGTVSIGKNKSIYDKYEISNLWKSLSDWYTKNKYNTTFDNGNTPLTVNAQKEYEYTKMRKSKIDFLEFIDNEYDGLVYDFKIGSLKVQEKICTALSGERLTVALCKSSGRTNGKRNRKPYEKGDNDFYWFNFPDKITFYVVPEHILIKCGYIKTVALPGKKNFNFSKDVKKLLENYKFCYDTITQKDNKNKLLKLLNIKEKIDIHEDTDSDEDQKPRKVKKKNIVSKSK